MRPTVKLFAGVALLVVGVFLPGLLAFGIATNFGFGRSSVEMMERDWCLAAPFALCALGLVATGIFLIVRRGSLLSRTARTLVVLGVVVGVLPAVGMVFVIQSRTVDNTADRQRWLRSIDEANAKAGFIRDTNGNLIFVGVTNGQTRSRSETSVGQTRGIFSGFEKN